jgi:hypothetical protein
MRMKRWVEVALVSAGLSWACCLLHPAVELSSGRECACTLQVVSSGRWGFGRVLSFLLLLLLLLLPDTLHALWDTGGGQLVHCQGRLAGKDWQMNTCSTHETPMCADLSACLHTSAHQVRVGV